MTDSQSLNLLINNVGLLCAQVVIAETAVQASWYALWIDDLVLECVLS